MGGGLMQLVAYGAQDIYLTGNPQITFFKVVYRRHTNFAVESIEQTFNGSAAAGSKISVTVSRNGDLLSSVFLVTKGSADIDSAVGDHWALIDNVEVEIGGQVIDKQYGHWMQVWTDLSHGGDKLKLLDESANGVFATGELSFVPLQFWFCRNPGLALPLIALQYHEVKLNVTFSSGADQLGAGSNVSVWCDYIFLDTDERRRFAQVSHEYLIEQVQFSNALSVSGTSTQHELRFNHPVKELVWTVHDNSTAVDHDGDANTGLKATDSDITVNTALLQLNGHDRFKRREGKYFTKVQRYQYHEGASDTERREAVAAAGGTAARADASVPHVYSFALKPEEHQPSGTCNFSRIDNAVLNLEHGSATGHLRVYAVNYNVLRIMSGMGGLAYSN
tara:strand:+ start:1093 stop:2265 length:1173 start_codon:yes stop_codon:yes gene_type:complete